MTKEEAIAYGKRVIDLGLNDETQAFCELAIKTLEQEPCEDAVSRQAIIDEMEKRHAEGDCITKGFVKNMPSVNLQKPKTGHWIEEFVDTEGEVRFTCSCCGKYQLFGTDFCYNCGAKMVEPQESEDEE